MTQGGSLLLSKEKAGLHVGVQRTLGSYENYPPGAFTVKEVRRVETLCKIESVPQIILIVLMERITTKSPSCPLLLRPFNMPGDNRVPSH